MNDGIRVGIGVTDGLKFGFCVGFDVATTLLVGFVLPVDEEFCFLELISESTIKNTIIQRNVLPQPFDLFSTDG